MRYEYFGKNNQTISLSGFYKDIDNPIEMTSFSSDPDNIQPRNTGDAKIFGLEFEARSNFPFLNNCYLNINSSIIKSEVIIVNEELNSRQNNLRVGEELDKSWFGNNIVRDMQGQAPFLINAGLSYKLEDINTEASLFYNVQGPTLSIVSMNKNPDIYTESFNSLNFNLSSKFNGKSKISFSIKNLLNDAKEMNTRSFGIENSIYRKYKPGRYFSIKWSYDF